MPRGCGELPDGPISTSPPPKDAAREAAEREFDSWFPDGYFAKQEMLRKDTGWGTGGDNLPRMGSAICPARIMVKRSRKMPAG